MKIRDKRNKCFKKMFPSKIATILGLLEINTCRMRENGIDNDTNISFFYSLVHHNKSDM